MRIAIPAASCLAGVGALFIGPMLGMSMMVGLALCLVIVLGGVGYAMATEHGPSHERSTCETDVSA